MENPQPFLGARIWNEKQGYRMIWEPNPAFLILFHADPIAGFKKAINSDG